MMHKAWRSIEEVPYYFWGSSIKFQGHTGWKIDNFNPIWVRLLGQSQLSNPSDLPCFVMAEWLWGATYIRGLMVSSWALRVKLLLWECHNTPLVKLQEWFMQWLCAIRQQAITWADVDPHLCHPIASLDHNELILTYCGLNRRLTVCRRHFQMHFIEIRIHTMLGWWAITVSCDILTGLCWQSRNLNCHRERFQTARDCSCAAIMVPDCSSHQHNTTHKIGILHGGHVSYPTDSPTATRLGLCSSLSSCLIPHWQSYCHQAGTV